MKKQVWYVALWMLAAIVLPAKSQTVYFQDGFENGLDSAWTQTYYDPLAEDGKGAWVSEAPQHSQPWKTETMSQGLEYPGGVVFGQGRAYFRLEAPEGQHVQSSGYRTRLITPLMDLRSGYQPILRFYHAQAKWTADFDTLRIYYRKGEQGTWYLLREYTEPILKWTFEEMTLPLVGKDYQLAFEADENMGRGIVLDSVIIRTKPQITTPHDLNYYDMRDNGLNLTWEASKDADYYRVIVSTKDLDLNVNPDSVESPSIVREELVPSEIQDIRLDTLRGGTAYYVQIQSLGEKENSVWSETYRIRMKSMVEIPYTEDFKLVYRSDKIEDLQLMTWCWGGDFKPFIPLSVGSDKYYMFSPDKSEAVVFPGTSNTSSSDVYTKAIPSDMTSWLVSPEISGASVENFSLSKCHVTFWGTTYTLQQDKARSIIVGVMTDPEDLTTFVAVDTCTVWGYQAFTYFDVDLSSYQGTGRYVAFVSYFAGQDNWFALDKVTIAERKLPRPVIASEIHVVPTTTGAVISWPKSEGATGYNIKSQKLISKYATIPLYGDDVSGTLSLAGGNSFTLAGLTPGSKYALTIRAVLDGALSEWSQPIAFYTSADVELPKTYGFETTDNGGTYTYNSQNYLKDWCFFSNDAVTPYCYKSSYARQGSYSLYGIVESSSDVWVVMPYVEDVTETEMNFYLRTTTMAYVGSSVDVGVMTEPTNLQTFEKVGSFVATDNTYHKCYINFVNYKGEGKYIAFRWGANGESKNAICIDDVELKKLANCFAPAVEVSEISDTSAVIRWTKLDPTYTYDVKVNSKSIAENALDITEGDMYDVQKTTLGQIKLEGLKYATTYYIYIRTHCSDSEYSDWSNLQFITDCPKMMQLPYSCNFDNDVAGMGLKPSCWIPAYMTATTTNPFLTKTYASTSPNSLYMTSTMSSGSFISLPEIDAELNNIIVHYKAYVTSVGYQIIVGVMADPNDYKCFEAIDTFSVPISGKWYDHKTMLLGQKGRGKHIAFTTFNGKSNTVYLDDVQVTDITDAPPFNYTKLDAGTDWIEAGWEGITSDQWQVVVTSKYYPLGEDDTFDPSVVDPGDKKGEAKTSDSKYKVPNGLSPQSWYYFYVRSTASDEWSMDSLQTECTKWNPGVAVSEGFEIGMTVTTSMTGTNDTAKNYFRFARIPQCWTVGNAQGVYEGQAVTYTQRNYWPYICSNGNISSLGSLSNYYDKGTALTTQCYSYAGFNSLKLYGYYSSTTSSNYAPAYAAMNELDCTDKDLQQLTISGYYQMTNTSGCALIVGVMDDPTDLSTFVVLDSITAGNGMGADKGIFFEVTLEDYTGTGRYIAFRTPTNKSTTIYLDDICVTAASCPAPKPSIYGVTDKTAILSSGLKVDNGWTYIVTSEQYSTAQLDKGIDPDPRIVVKQGSILQVDGDPAFKTTRITGLTPDTTYYVYVATLCDGQKSAWRQTKFTTLCPPVDVTTWLEGFTDYATGSNSDMGCWTVGNLTASASTSYIPYVSESKRKELGKVLGLYCTSAYTGAYAISPGLQIPNGKSLNDYMICFYGYGTSSITGTTTSATYEHNLRVGVMTDPSDVNTMKILDTISLGTKTQLCHVLLDKLQVESDKTYYIIFYLERDYTTYARAAVDSISLQEIPDCRFPTNIYVDNITYTTAEIGWNGTSSSYKVALSPRELSEAERDSILNDDALVKENNIVMKTTGQLHTQVKDLTANTRYYVYVQGVCGYFDPKTYSDWSYELVYFKTDCAPYVSLPFSDNFDNYVNYGTGYQPDCYYGYQDKGSSTSTSASYGPKYYPCAHNTTGYNSKHSIYFYAVNNTTAATSCILSVPALDPNVDPATLQINFWARRGTKTATYKSTLILGMVKSQTEVETFVPLDTINLTDLDVDWHYQEYNLNLGKYQSVLQQGYENFAFYMPTPSRSSGTATYNSMYLDNLKITYIPTCYVPKDMKLTQVGFSSLRMQFTPAVESDYEWDVLVKETRTGIETHYPVYTTSPLLEGLKHSTEYAVQVRTTCGDQDYSEYTDPVTFNTKWEIDTYTWTFDQNEQGTVSVLTTTSGTLNKHILHPGLTADVRDTTWHSASPHMYLPYQEFNTTSLSYSTDPHGSEQDGDTARALKFNATILHDSVTVILPSVRNAKQKQLSMDVRSGEQYTDNHSTVTLHNVVSNSFPRATISIGVVDSMCGIQTFQELTSWRPSQLFKTDTLHEASHYGWDHVVLPLSGYDLRGKQLALMMHGCGSATMYVDNLSIEAITGQQTPYISNIEIADTYVTLHWTGNASKYNVYMIDTARASGMYPRFIPYLQDADNQCVVKKTNISGNTCKIDGLTENSTYAFYVEDAGNASKTGALSNRKIVTTVCAAIDASTGWETDFEPGPMYVNNGNPATSVADGFTWILPNSTTAQDTLYKVPECWQVGLTTDLYDQLSPSNFKTYLPVMNCIWGTSSSTTVGWDGSYALAFYGSNTTYKEQYAVLPLFEKLNKANSELWFMGRCGYVSTSNGKFSPLMSTSTRMIVGTMSDPNDHSTFVPLDTVNWDYTKADIPDYSIDLTSDPTGQQYFQTFAVPLDKMQGNYIAFRQVENGTFYIDNLKIQSRQTTRHPRDLHVLKMEYNTATLGWRNMEEGGTFVVEISESYTDWSKAQSQTVSENKATFTGLTESQTYYYRVKQITTMGESRYAHAEQFTTTCASKDPNTYSTSFEGTDTDQDMVIPTMTSLKQNRCWQYLQRGSSSTTASYFPQNIAPDNIKTYAHSGTMALKLYAATSSNKLTADGYAILPKMEAEVGKKNLGFDTLQLVFWACPSPHYLNKGEIAVACPASDAKCMEIGTCTDPDDLSTYTLLEKWYYKVDGNVLAKGATADIGNDYAFQKVVVKLNKATGQYIYLRASLDRGDNVGYSTCTLYVDDLHFEHLTNCDAPTELSVSNMTCSQAVVKWVSDANNFDVMVSRDPTFTDESMLIASETNLKDKQLQVKGLQAQTNYYFRVKAYCDAERKNMSDWSQNGLFRTPYSPLYQQSFTSANFASEDGWTTYSGYADKVFAGQIKPSVNSSTGSYNNWQQVQNIAFQGYAMRLQLYYTTNTENYWQKYWLVSPGIAIEGDSAQLIFNLAQTYYKASSSSTESSRDVRTYDGWDQGWDDQFMVIISDDNGATWKKENAIIWNDETSKDAQSEHYRYGPGQYSLRALTADPTQYAIDLKKYAGKTIRVAFYAENTEQNCQTAIHIDNFHVNYLTKYEQSLVRCQFEDVVDVLGFYVSGDSVSAGDTIVSRSSISVMEGENDSILTLYIHYLEAPIYNENITVCEGTPFKYKDFNEHSAPGTYRMKLTSQVTGCDSIVNLTIQHTSAYTVVIDTTVRYGSAFVVGDKVYTEPGFYMDTLQASEKMGGCDSIVVLNLAYTSQAHSDLYQQVCKGESWYWADADTTLSTTGLYSRCVSDICDSIVVMHFTAIDPVRTIVEDSILEGMSYAFADNWYTKAGTYIDTVKAESTGCDSILELHLYVVAAPIIYTRDTFCYGGSYTFGKLLIKEPGTYRDSTYDGKTHAMAITQLTLTALYPSSSSMGTQLLQPGETYPFFGRSLNATGTYYETLTAANGCDSVVSVTIVVQEVGSYTEEKNVCPSELPYTWKDSIVCEKAGIYTCVIPREGQLDSTIYLVLTVIEPVHTSLEDVICLGGSYHFGDTTLSKGGTYYDTVPSLQTGCDSIIILTLVQNELEVRQHTEYVCEGDSMLWNGIYISKPALYRDTMIDESSECKYIDELTLRNHYLVTVDVAEHICEGDSIIFNGEVLKTTCTREMKSQSLVTGCDSVTRLTLNVGRSSQQSIPMHICHGDTVYLGLKPLTESGTYSDTLVSYTGCDSIVSIILMVSQPLNTIINDSICSGQTYTFAGKQYTQSGTYRDTVIDENMCMSIRTLNLSVRAVGQGSQTSSFCQSFTYMGKVYTKSGIYTIPFTNEYGCDTVVTLTLIQSLDAHDTTRVSICKGQRYEDEDFIVWNPGKYEAKIFEKEGCIMTRILYLDVVSDTMTLDTVVYQDQLPYKYHSLVYPDTTPVGMYQDTIEVSYNASCYQTVFHTLWIKEGSGWQDIYGTARPAAHKILYHDQLYIIKDDKWYDLTGSEVANPTMRKVQQK